jgi:hypothetical protein
MNYSKDFKTIEKNVMEIIHQNYDNKYPEIDVLLV